MRHTAHRYDALLPIGYFATQLYCTFLLVRNIVENEDSISQCVTPETPKLLSLYLIKHLRNARETCQDCTLNLSILGSSFTYSMVCLQSLSNISAK